jgi:formate hydrogenlyase subunit 3/multisubunit Na+/H+ antiporter MnhD subunit
MINHALFKGILFLATSYMIVSLSGKGDIKDLKGIYKKMPLTSFIVAFSIIALLGVPPLSGFWAKMMILSGVMGTGHKIVVALMLFATIVEAVYYLKFIAVIYDRSGKVENFDKSSLTLNKFLPVIFFLVVILLFSLVPQFLTGFNEVLYKASKELTNVTAYVSIVLGN